MEDQLGTLNFLTPEKTRRATGLVREGVTISCARTIRYDAGPDSPAPPIHYMVESGEGWASGEKVSNRRNQVSVDFFGMIFHGHTITHLDSLAHFFWEGKMYNGPTGAPGLHQSGGDCRIGRGGEGWHYHAWRAGGRAHDPRHQLGGTRRGSDAAGYRGG